MAALPEYVAVAKPVPRDKRVAWFSGIAPTYMGVMVWFAFWASVPGFGGTPGGMLSAGLWPPLLGIVLAALIIHFLFYLVPGLLGMKTGLPLYVVGTSTYGVQGGLLMPGFLMGILQFFWLGFNAFAVSGVLCKCFEIGLGAKGEPAVPGVWHGVMAAAFVILAALVGLKGIQYVAKIATFFPIIPIAVLVILLVSTVGGLGKFTPEKIIDAQKKAAAAAKEKEAAEPAEGQTAAEKAEQANAEAAKAKEPPKPLDAIGVILAMVTCIVGFFATAGAAGVDIAMNSRDSRNVQLGGLIGIALATIFSCCLAVVVVAGYYGGAEEIPANLQGKIDPIELMKGGILTAETARILMILLAISSFPAACFSSLIAANSFKTTLPNVNPFISVGIGAAGSCLLAVTGWAGDAAAVFGIIGASFGPICGAMVADYLLAGMRWAGPRAGFNLAGWLSWAVGFLVGAPDLLARIPGMEAMAGQIPCPPVAAFVVGFVLYAVLAKAGLESKSLGMARAK